MPPRIPTKKKKEIINLAIKQMPKQNYSKIARVYGVSRKTVYNIMEDFNAQFQIKEYKRNILDPLRKKTNELRDIEHNSFKKMWEIKDRCGLGYEGSKECEKSQEYKDILDEYEIDELNADKAQRKYDKARKEYDKLQANINMEERKQKKRERTEKWMKKHAASEKNYNKLIASEDENHIWRANIHYDEKQHKWVRDYKKRNKPIKEENKNKKRGK